MGGKMYLGNQLVTPVIFDVSLEFKDIQGNPYDNTELKNALDGKQDVIDDLSTIRSNAEAGKSASNTIETYGNIVTHNVSEFATASQGSKADTALQPSALDGYATQQWVVGQGYLTEITSTMITNSLGYTPYDSTNPSGYQANILEGVQVNGTDLTITNKKVNVVVPTNNNQLTNGAGYITIAALSDYATQTWVGQQGYLTSSAISNMQTTTNLVTSVDSSSTDSQYPSAKLFYDTCGDIETLINAL